MHDLHPVAYRDLTFDDMPWVLSLAHKRYPTFDPGGALRFLAIVIPAPQALTIRSEGAFLIASHVAAPPWYPDQPECHVMALCAEAGAHWEAARLMRRSVAWAREQGCVRWRFHSETEHLIGALAERVGARKDSPRYVIDLSHG